MLQSVDLKAKGIRTFPNPLSLPKGSLLRARNKVVDRPDTVETRRGFKPYGDALDGIGHALTSYMSRLLVHNGSNLSYDSDGAGTWVNYAGTFDPPSSLMRMKFAESSKNIYFTTDAGIMRLDALAGTPVAAGVVKALGGTGATTGGSGWMTNSTNVAYRITWAVEDANKNFHEGAPSQRIVVSNSSGGTRDVALTFLIPDTITTDYVYRVYRSPVSANLTTEPIDDMQLVLEFNPTGGEISAQTVTITDSTPDALKGDALYTGSNQEGILNANDQPPLALDIALFGGTMLYANTETRQNFSFTLQTRLASNDTITIDGVVYTAKGTETPSSGEFKFFTGGTLADDIESTALSLVSVVNQYASNTTVYAFYVSGFNDLPGRIQIQARSLGSVAFDTISSNGGAWSPDLTSAVESTNDDNPNYLYCSKDGQPEAVPFKNFLPIGAANKALLRIIPLRDVVLLYTEGGIFSLSGTDISDFQVTPFDNTVRINAPDAAIAFNNSAYAFADQGIVASSNAEGSPIMSRDIERVLVEISGPLYPAFSEATWAAPYESDRKYVLGTVSAQNDTSASTIWTYNALTNCWTDWDIAAAHGYVNPADNKLYYVNGTQVHQERKNFDRTDYADDELEVEIVGSVGTTVELVDTTGIEAGETLFQDNGGDGRDSLIIEVVDGTHIEVEDDLTWDADDAIVYSPIETETEWAPIHMDNPGEVKHFKEMALFFREVNFDALSISFTSDLSSATSVVELAPQTALGWETVGWDTTGWEGGSALPQAIRMYIPLEVRRARWIQPKIVTNQALKSFACTGLSMFADVVSPRTK